MASLMVALVLVDQDHNVAYYNSYLLFAKCTNQQRKLSLITCIAQFNAALIARHSSAHVCKARHVDVDHKMLAFTAQNLLQTLSRGTTVLSATGNMRDSRWQILAQPIKTSLRQGLRDASDAASAKHSSALGGALHEYMLVQKPIPRCSA
ncbi:hypothetical protein PoB_005194800 [Plakobranchus ocellatus]|uniref:Uncharacterized protein n=1 Tax=Plakobranchus ocellatus TaxID=259542 RepID=A0AAV4C1Z6_9GAST|nr:hypothetical protein PoB_005194800 [Plakobranchus ocellatus]